MQIEKLVQLRKERGYEIAQKQKVVNQNGVWLVPSATNARKIYRVVLALEGSKCDCEDFKERGLRCKHQWAVELTISKQFNQDGSTTITKTKRITYPQNWSAYEKSQIHEKELFMKLMGDLCKDIDEPVYVFGRPQLPLRDMVFASALKVFTTFSYRRFMSDLTIALEKGHMSQPCSYRSVSGYMQDEKLTPILNRLITMSSLPLKALETKFAVDSSGFRTTKFNDYCREKHRLIGKEHQWIKVHICTGVKTNTITAVEVSLNPDSADSNSFIPLVDETYSNGFDMQEVSADKAYSARKNLDAVHQLGGVPYIPFKQGTTGEPNGVYIWKKMFRYFTYNREEFMEHYHNRSNVESTFNMVKSKFTDLVRSKDMTARINEVLLKVLCHNIVVLIQSINEFDVSPEFIR